jgi:hypothetical protein
LCVFLSLSVLFAFARHRLTMPPPTRPLYPFTASQNTNQGSAPPRNISSQNSYARYQPNQGPPRATPSPLNRPYGQANAQAAPNSSTNLLAPSNARSVQATFARPPSNLSASTSQPAHLSLVCICLLQITRSLTYTLIERKSLSRRQRSQRFSSLSRSFHI